MVIHFIGISVAAIADDFRVVYSQIKVGQRLSDEFVLSYFGYKIINEPMAWSIWKVKDKIEIPEVNSFNLLVDIENAVGGDEYLYSLDENGNKIDSIHLTKFAHWDGGFNRATSYLRCAKNIFLITNSNIDYFGGGVIGDLDTHTYSLGMNGKIVQDDNLICKKYRKYSELSKFKLTTDALVDKSSEDIRVMRNEIFAEHGYIFSDSKLSSYFKRMDWYVPKSKNVSGSLSDIEKKNIEILLEYEQKIKINK